MFIWTLFLLWLMPTVVKCQDCVNGSQDCACIRYLGVEECNPGLRCTDGLCKQVDQVATVPSSAVSLTHSILEGPIPACFCGRVNESSYLALTTRTVDGIRVQADTPPTLSLATEPTSFPHSVGVTRYEFGQLVLPITFHHEGSVNLLLTVAFVPNTPLQPLATLPLSISTCRPGTASCICAANNTCENDYTCSSTTGRCLQRQETSTPASAPRAPDAQRGESSSNDAEVWLALSGLLICCILSAISLVWYQRHLSRQEDRTMTSVGDAGRAEQRRASQAPPPTSFATTARQLPPRSSPLPPLPPSQASLTSTPSAGPPSTYARPPPPPAPARPLPAPPRNFPPPPPPPFI